MQVRMILKYRQHLQNLYNRYVSELEACLKWSDHLAVMFRERHPNE